MTHDTIAAIATAPGQGGVSIVRLSGGEAEKILMGLFRPAKRGLTALTSHMLTYGHVMDGAEVIDECMAVIMRAPRSYTREDVVEFQLHGGAFTPQRVLNCCLHAGARLAEPGEFTRRAFLNGRMDLSEAEAVMSLIAARGEQAHRAAMRQLQGGASSFIRQAADELYTIAAGIAACVDYPEEITEEEATEGLSPKLKTLADKLDAACSERSARLLTQGLQVVLCGRPNVGKSSLLNAILGEDRAIVTPIPGTTRDVVTGDMLLGGCQIHLTDTAGLRDTDDPVERLGVARSGKAMAEADVVLVVLDHASPLTEADKTLLQEQNRDNTLVIVNKTDLPPVWDVADIAALCPKGKVLTLAAALPDTLQPLKEELRRRATVSDQLALTQPRHMDAARRAAGFLRQAAATVDAGLPVDLTTVDMTAAQCALGEITGDQVDEKLLDAVFSQFCVGK